MVAKRSLIIVIWLLIAITASVIIWQMQHENNTNSDQTTTPSRGVAEQSSATPQSGTPTDDKKPANTELEAAFKKQVVLYYEISNTENRSKQTELFPIIATKHFLDSYRWNFPSDSTTVTTKVDAGRTSIKWEDSTTSKNVRYATTEAYVIKIDTSTKERYENLYPADYTTWIREPNGIWKIHGATLAKEAPTSP